MSARKKKNSLPKASDDIVWETETIDYGNLGLFAITGISGMVMISSVPGKSLLDGRYIDVFAMFEGKESFSACYAKTEHDPIGTMSETDARILERAIRDLYSEWISTPESMDMLSRNSKKNPISREQFEKDKESFVKMQKAPQSIAELHDAIVSLSISHG